MIVPRAESLSRLPSLTGMRFLAAFVVFTCHASVTGYFTTGAAAHLTRFAYCAGWFGVEFFFVLSGFVLTWSVREGEPRHRFWRRRLVKVYPNHLLVWLVAIGLAAWAGQSIDFWHLLPSLFLVHTWYPDIHVIVTINVVTWSLGCDIFFYLIFPFLYGLLKRIPERRLWLSVGVVTAVILVLPAFATLLSSTPRLPSQDMSLLQNWFLVSFPPTRCLDFTLGILMARIVRANRWIGLGIAPGLAIVAVGVALQLLAWPTVYGLTSTVALPLALLITAVAVADDRGKRSPFRSRPLVWLGGISYAFYLVHYLVLDYGHIPIGATRTWPVPAALGIIAAMLVVATTAAWLLTRLVEEPAMRRWARPRARALIPREPTVASPAPSPETATLP